MFEICKAGKCQMSGTDIPVTSSVLRCADRTWPTIIQKSFTHFKIVSLFGSLPCLSTSDASLHILCVCTVDCDGTFQQEIYSYIYSLPSLP
jgi:hypothetical protein